MKKHRRLEYVIADRLAKELDDGFKRSMDLDDVTDEVMDKLFVTEGNKEEITDGNEKRNNR